MKKFLIGGLLLVSVVGCSDGLTDREESCLDNGGTWSECTSEGRYQERELARIEAKSLRNSNMYDTDSYPPVGMGEESTNYYGDERHGSWDNQGSFRFNNPHSPQASSTNSFLLGVGLGGLGAYMLTKSAMRSDWNKSNPSGWSKQSRKSTRYIDKKGNTITKAEHKKRKAQSRNARKANSKKIKNTVKQKRSPKNKKVTTNKFKKKTKQKKNKSSYSNKKKKSSFNKKTTKRRKSSSNKKRK